MGAASERQTPTRRSLMPRLPQLGVLATRAICQTWRQTNRTERAGSRCDERAVRVPKPLHSRGFVGISSNHPNDPNRGS
jgi:hypothetical protein